VVTDKGEKKTAAGMQIVRRFLEQLYRLLERSQGGFLGVIQAGDVERVIKFLIIKLLHLIKSAVILLNWVYDIEGQHVSR